MRRADGGIRHDRGNGRHTRPTTREAWPRRTHCRRSRRISRPRRERYEFASSIVDDGSTDNTATRWPRHSPPAPRRPRPAPRAQPRLGRCAAHRFRQRLTPSWQCCSTPISVIRRRSPWGWSRSFEAIGGPTSPGVAVRPGRKRLGVPVAAPCPEPGSEPSSCRWPTVGKHATLTCMVRAFRVCALRSCNSAATKVGHRRDAVSTRCDRRCGSSKFPQPWSGRRSATQRAAGFNVPHGPRQIAARLHWVPSSSRAVAGGTRTISGAAPAGRCPAADFRVKSTTLAIGTTATIVVQYTSLALFTGQITALWVEDFAKNVAYQTNGA